MGRAYSLAFRSCRLLVLVAAGVFLIAPAHGRGAQVDGADSSLVGPLGDPARLVFRGCETYDPAEIRNELAHDLDVQVAAAPTASRADYLRIIEQRVTVGYRNGGFADPQVTVREETQDGDANAVVVVTVVEGPRYRCGPVTVSGANTIPVDRLRRRLTTPLTETMFSGILRPNAGPEPVDAIRLQVENLPDLKPLTIWEVGKPARFDEPQRASLQRKVRRALCELGYFRARFDVSVKPGEGGEATLLIDVADEGPVSTIDTIGVGGLKKNKRADLLRFLGWEPGKAIDLAALEAAQEKLWQAARFKKHVLTATLKQGDPSKMQLWLDLEEYEPAPALGEPFTPTEQALLNARQWLLSMTEREEDLVIEGNDPVIESSIIAGRDGAAFWAGRPRPQRDGDAPDDVAAAANDADGAGPWDKYLSHPLVGVLLDGGGAGFVATGESWGVYMPSQKFMIDSGNRSVEANFVLATDVDEAGKGKWTMNIGAETNSRRRSEARGRSPVSIRLVLAPVAFVYLAHLPDHEYEIVDGVLSVHGENSFLLRIEAATGRLVEFRIQPGGLPIRVRMENGALAAKIAAMEGAKGLPNRYDPRHPWGSAFSFAAEQVALYFAARGADTQPPEARAAAVRKLLDPVSFEPLDQLVAGGDAGANGEDEVDPFRIPLDVSTLTPRGMSGQFVLVTLPYVNDVFPRGSWPWTVSREMLLVFGGKPSESAAEVSRVFSSDETGPIGFLVCAEILSRADPDMAAMFARRGLRRLSAEHFAQDCRVLLDGDSILPQVTRGFIQNLRGLDPREVAAVAAALPPDYAARFTRLAEAVRAERDTPAGEVARRALQRLWEQSLRREVEAELTRVAALAGPDE